MKTAVLIPGARSAALLQQTCWRLARQRRQEPVVVSVHVAQMQPCLRVMRGFSANFSWKLIGLRAPQGTEMGLSAWQACLRDLEADLVFGLHAGVLVPAGTLEKLQAVCASGVAGVMARVGEVPILRRNALGPYGSVPDEWLAKTCEASPKQTPDTGVTDGYLWATTEPSAQGIIGWSSGWEVRADAPAYLAGNGFVDGDFMVEQEATR